MNWILTIVVVLLGFLLGYQIGWRKHHEKCRQFKNHAMGGKINRRPDKDAIVLSPGEHYSNCFICGASVCMGDDWGIDDFLCNDCKEEDKE